MSEFETLEQFIHTCSAHRPETDGRKFVGWEGHGRAFGLRRPQNHAPGTELKQWLKLGGTVIALKRLEIRKKLESYALEKELDFEAAEQAAQNIADNINPENLESLVNELERSGK